ncbi:uroporphyrinogen decarboxylase [Mumia sp. zg.B53]|uniref:uroporphyrinogen decarboxylase n=1 Tax=unclassified Mumia TaxID=2621872 RepID=UPI001C6E614B|nr:MULTISPECIES: uroporphyrinogen decarboxylase [unclassified Mumia]MBW9216758.1 uroporphyrinogen decarboxylase [Mumia sp. zg.B53]MDD9350229.1 uroporphyrinogen decarboxylase [Mumia sp.]
MSAPQKDDKPEASSSTTAAPSPAKDGTTPKTTSAFLAACRGEKPTHVPVWFMRQAGRSLPEYRKLREGVPMLESCTRPEMVVEITMQPVRRYGVDAAIFYSDIVVPLKAIGVDLDIVPGTGPVVATPIRTAKAVAKQLRDLEPSDVEYVTESVRGLVGELGDTPLIGFAGAPFTLASYLIEGGPSRDHRLTKELMYRDPETWDALLGRLASIAAAFLRVQVEAGARAVQLFDSWAGSLSREDYVRYVKPYAKTVLDAVADLDVPRIHFGVGTGELLTEMGDAGADVVGVDWRVALDDGIARVGPGRSVQGNLDPTVVFAPDDIMKAKADAILDAGSKARGHVFNLGHGVLPATDPDALKRLVDHVHAYELR